jgi:hypothetical protein
MTRGHPIAADDPLDVGEIVGGTGGSGGKGCWYIKIVALVMR